LVKIEREAISRREKLKQDFERKLLYQEKKLMEDIYMEVVDSIIEKLKERSNIDMNEFDVNGLNQKAAQQAIAAISDKI
jgi:nucleoid DNA-binding protein